MDETVSKNLTAIVIGIVGVVLLVGLFIHNFRDMEETTNQGAQVTDETPDGELTPEQRYILVEKGTEAPFTSDLLNEKRKGTYYAADTKEAVFRSEDKFDSGTGWPSFTKPVSPEVVEEHSDVSHGMTRTEVTSSEGGHLGHVFTDGPADKGGLRYCINGDALYFVPDEPQAPTE